MAAPTQDQVIAQIRLIIPAIGTIVTAFGLQATTVDHYTQAILVSAGPIAYLVTAIWSLYANSRASIMASAAKPVAPGVPPPQIILPHEEAALAEALPANVISPPEKK
jgi:hypothetical protein